MLAPLVQFFLEGGKYQGFAQEVVHAHIEATLAVFNHGAGGEGDDGQTGIAAAPGAEFCGGLVAIELWHLAIHEDEVNWLFAQNGQCFTTVLSQANLTAEAKEHALKDHLIDRVVFGDQDL